MLLHRDFNYTHFSPYLENGTASNVPFSFSFFEGKEEISFNYLSLFSFILKAEKKKERIGEKKKRKE